MQTTGLIESIKRWVFGPHGKLSFSCPSCGNPTTIFQTFCPECGVRMDTRLIVCDKCHRNIEPSAKFCPHCQTSVNPGRAEREATFIIWKRGPEQFARKLDLNFDTFKDAEIRRVGFIVEYGNRALLIVDGAKGRVLEAGRYAEAIGKDGLRTSADPDRLEREGVFDLISRAQKYVSVVIIQATDLDLRFLFHPGQKDGQTNAENLLLTSEDVPIGADLRITLRLTEPSVFVENVMGSRDLVVEGDLRNHFYEELRDALGEETRTHAAEALIKSDRSLKDKIESNLAKTMQRTLQRAGLDLVQVRSLFVAQDDMREMVLARGQLEMSRRRLEITKQFLTIGNQQKLAQANSQAELERMMLEVDRARVMTREEFVELSTAFAEGRGDRARTMQFLDEKLKVMYEVELRRVKLLEEGKLTLAQVEQQIEKRRKELDFDRDKRQRETEQKFGFARKQLDLWADQNRVALDIERQRNEMTASQWTRYFEALGKLPPDALALYLATQNPEASKVLVARAQAEGMQKVVDAYQNILPQFKEVVAVAAGARGFVFAGTAHGMAYGLPGGTVLPCPKCGGRDIPESARFCPTCGTSLKHS